MLFLEYFLLGDYLDDRRGVFAEHGVCAALGRVERGFGVGKVGEGVIFLGLAGREDVVF